jgi:hypothetical protein
VTVIVWDGNTIAADKRTVYNGVFAVTTKLFKLDNGDVVAGSGSKCVINEMIEWYKSGASASEYPRTLVASSNSILLVVRPDKTVLLYEDTPYPTSIQQIPFAIGCGRDAALGALAMGADAIKAVEVASSIDINCGNGCDYFVITG